MKCINKRIFAVFSIFVFALSLCGCGEIVDPNAYQVYESSYQYGITKSSPMSSARMFASDLCVTGGEDKGVDEVASHVAYAGGLFNVSTKDVLYSQSIYEKMYPASTTKILTCLIALKYGNLDDVYTVSEHACDQEFDASVAELSPGDQVTLRELLYGLMLVSGNDAAIAIAEGMSGSEEAFSELMNREAHMLGATKSHFITPNGLHNDDHYTTVYDMYLIFNEAIKNETFLEIIKTASYTANITSANGNPKQLQWDTTNQYLNGKRKIPDGITVIGGKTGTTTEAGLCLVLLSKNANNDDIISIVFHADSRTNLYYLTSELLTKFAVVEDFTADLPEEAPPAEGQ